MAFDLAGRRGQTRQEKMIMTRDKAVKAVVRHRMAETGEPYTVARRAVAESHGEGLAPDTIAAETQAALHSTDPTPTPDLPELELAADGPPEPTAPLEPTG